MNRQPDNPKTQLRRPTVAKPGRKVRDARGKESGILFIASIAVLMILTVYAFKPALEGKFTTWDDNQYITQNPDMRPFSPDYLAGAFTRFELGNYHPLTMVSFSMNYSGSNPRPEPFHRTNLVLHLLNLILVLLLVRKLTRNDLAVFITAALFALHATRVESVAWISARKEVLYAFFFLLSMFLYLVYAGKGKKRLYWMSLLCFLMSLLSKGTAVVLAPLLVVTDVYLDRKAFSTRILLEKVPFFLLALAAGIVTLMAQSGAGAIRAEPALGLSGRLVMAAGNVWLYVQQLVFPAGLRIFYPYPVTGEGGIEPAYYFYAALAVLLTSVILLVSRKLREGKTLLFGFAFFLVGISPLLQLLPVGDAAMADRYTYIPGLGIFLVLAILLKEAVRKLGYSRILYALLLLLIPLTLQTRAKARAWKDSRSLVASALEKEPSIPQFLLLRGQLAEAEGDRVSAMSDYTAALHTDPLFVPALNNRAVLLAWEKRNNEAERDLRLVISRDPAFAPGWSNLGFVLTRQQRYREAIPALDKALAMNPSDAMALGNRGYCHLQTGNPLQAMIDLDQSLSAKPDNPFSFFFRAMTHLSLKDTATACHDLQQAIRLGYRHYIDGEPDSLFRVLCRSAD